MPNELLFQIGLTLIPLVGDVNGKRLLAYCGSPEAVFKEKRSSLEKIPGIGHVIINSIVNHSVFDRAEKEIEFIEKHEIIPLFFTNSGYPSRLLNCEDGPLMLYYKGTSNLNTNRVVAIVGTRRPTNYGKAKCEEFVDFLSNKNVLIVSGLAYGIDSNAHRRSVFKEVETVGVLGHGLDKLYPSQNRKLAEKMLERGGLLTEFKSGTNPDRENFPKRNRIVAGMCDAVIVIESGRKGGALITAEIANSYNRDVFAIPGRTDDEVSKGCNQLIKTNRAALAESGKDIAYIMGWDDKPVAKKIQTQMFADLSEDEKVLIDIIREAKEIGIDQLALQSGLSASKIATALLSLEFEGIIKSLPGKQYSL
jgi:DNA processing protein